MKNNNSQQEIHKTDMSGVELSIEAQIDTLFSDLLEQATLLAEAKNETEKNQRISMIREYIRGHRDGFRLLKRNPYAQLKNENMIYDIAGNIIQEPIQIDDRAIKFNNNWKEIVSTLKTK